MVHSAKKKDIKYNRYDANRHIDRTFIEQLRPEQQDICTYCKIHMKLDCENLSDNLLTVERIDNNIGHIKSNCVLACCKCNNTRGKHFTYEEYKQKVEQETPAETEREWGKP